jgi:hypothetical protein
VEWPKTNLGRPDADDSPVFSFLQWIEKETAAIKQGRNVTEKNFRNLWSFVWRMPLKRFTDVSYTDLSPMADSTNHSLMNMNDFLLAQACSVLCEAQWLAGLVDRMKDEEFQPHLCDRVEDPEGKPIPFYSMLCTMKDIETVDRP